jgi:hypothetical protein
MEGNVMNKLLSALTAGMMVLAMNGFAVAQDVPAKSQPNTQQSAQPATQQDTQAQPASEAGDVSAKQDAQAGDVSAKEQEYSAALTKCETLSSSEKTKCIEAAKKKLGQM